MIASLERWISHPLGSVVICILAGASLGVAYAPYYLWLLAIMAVGIFVVVIWHSPTRLSRLCRGYLFGVGYFLVTISYLATVHWLIAIVSILAMSMWTSLLAILQGELLRVRCWPIWTAASWISMEYAMQRFPFGGFAWTRLGYTSVDQPLGNYLWLISTSGVGFLIAFLGSLGAWIFLRAVPQSALEASRRSPSVSDVKSFFCSRLAPSRRWRWPALNEDETRNRIKVVIMVTIALFATGTLMAWMPVGEPPDRITVGIVQGNIDRSHGSHWDGYARSVTNNHLSSTIELIARAKTGMISYPDVIAWPENAADDDPRTDSVTYSDIDFAARLGNIPILVGAVMRGPGEGQRQTSALWWRPDKQVTARYDKRNAVPFGEYTPMKDMVFALWPQARQVGLQTVPGDQPGAMKVSYGLFHFILGPIICYELAFDSTVYDTVNNGAQLLIVQSNNATYSDTSQPVQQFAITRARAKELRREIVIATTNSYSGLISARGRVRTISEPERSAVTTVTLPLRSSISPAARYGRLIEMAIASAGVLPLLHSALSAIRLRFHGRIL